MHKYTSCRRPCFLSNWLERVLRRKLLRCLVGTVGFRYDLKYEGCQPIPVLNQEPWTSTGLSRGINAAHFLHPGEPREGFAVYESEKAFLPERELFAIEGYSVDGMTIGADFYPAFAPLWQNFDQMDESLSAAELSPAALERCRDAEAIVRRLRYRDEVFAVWRYRNNHPFCPDQRTSGNTDHPPALCAPSHFLALVRESGIVSCLGFGVGFQYDIENDTSDPIVNLHANPWLSAGSQEVDNGIWILDPDDAKQGLGLFELDYDPGRFALDGYVVESSPTGAAFVRYLAPMWPSTRQLLQGVEDEEGGWSAQYREGCHELNAYMRRMSELKEMQIVWRYEEDHPVYGKP